MVTVTHSIDDYIPDRRSTGNLIVVRYNGYRHVVFIQTILKAVVPDFLCGLQRAMESLDRSTHRSHCWRCLATLPMESYLRVDRPCTTHVWRDFFCDLLVCSCAACVFLLFSRVFMCGVRFSMVFLCVHVWREHCVRTVKCNVPSLPP